MYWFKDAKEEINNDLELGYISQEQYDRKLKMLLDEKQEDEFY